MDHLNSVTSGEGAKSQTPLTDAVDAALGKFDAGRSYPRMRDFARKLEADRAELLEALREIHKHAHFESPRGDQVVEAACRGGQLISIREIVDPILSRLSDTPATTGREG